MKLLIDTHYLIWLANDPAEISTAEHALLGENSGQVYVSPVSIWEVRLKWEAPDRNGARKGVLAPEIAMAYIGESDLKLVPLTGADCAMALASPVAHKDPFDEMLLIHAQQLGARLLTRDRLLRDHPLAISP
jgi:PIN domain nuclease of toxin-antitoxin system